MKRIFPAVVLLGALSAFAPAHAAPTGCATVPMMQPSGAQQYDQSCHYTATGKAEYVVATTDRWTITVSYIDSQGKTKVRFFDSDDISGAPSAPKELPSEQGDRVEITHGAGCAPVACAQTGAIAAFELHP